MKPMNRRPRQKCEFCKHNASFTYTRPEELRRYVNRVGKILPRRVSRLCAKHQRVLAREVKRARAMALLAYAAEG
jgi:small subunit ribosomal protein S18